MTNSSGSVVLNQIGATVQLSSAYQAPPKPVVLDSAQIQKSYGKTLTTLSTTVVAKATNDAKAAEEKVEQKQEAVDEAAAEAEEAKAAAEQAVEEAKESGDKEAIEEAQKLEQIAEEKAVAVEEAIMEVEAAKEVVEKAIEKVEVANEELKVQEQQFEQFGGGPAVEDKPQADEPGGKPGDDGPEDKPDEQAQEDQAGGEEEVAPEGEPVVEEEKLLEEVPLEEAPLEEAPIEEGPKEEAPKEEVEVKEEPQIIEEAKPIEQPIEQAPEPIVEAAKPEVVAPPPIVFVAPVAEPIIIVQKVVEHYQEPEPIIEYFAPVVIETPKFSMMARAMAAPILVIEPVIEEVVEEETVEEPQPNLLDVGEVGDTISSTLNVGYYSMSNGQGLSKQIAPIEEAGHNAVKMTTLSETELAGIDILWAINPSNSSHGNEYKNAIDDIKNRVDEGMVLIIHDRQVGNAENILFGEEPADIVRKFTNSRAIDVVDENTVVGEGPGGFLTDTSIDGGNSSNHGYTKKDTLPDDSLALLTTSDEDEIVDFAYKYGEGAVIYSSIPLDYYLGGAKPNFKDIYAPNVIQFGASLILDGYKTLEGSNSSDIIAGTHNNDTIKGKEGGDTIYGLFGNDTIVGGEGADNITGGSGSDIYTYTSKEESPVGGGDIIKDYEQDEKLDLSAIASTFNIVPSFTSGGNTPEVTFNASTKLLQMDLDNDAVADMEVTLENYNGSFQEGSYENGVLS